MRRRGFCYRAMQHRATLPAEAAAMFRLCMQIQIRSMGLVSRALTGSVNEKIEPAMANPQSALGFAQCTRRRPMPMQGVMGLIAVLQGGCAAGGAGVPHGAARRGADHHVRRAAAGARTAPVSLPAAAGASCCLESHQTTRSCRGEGAVQTPACGGCRKDGMAQPMCFAQDWICSALALSLSDELHSQCCKVCREKFRCIILLAA